MTASRVKLDSQYGIYSPGTWVEILSWPDEEESMARVRFPDGNIEFIEASSLAAPDPEEPTVAETSEQPKWIVFLSDEEDVTIDGTLDWHPGAANYRFTAVVDEVVRLVAVFDASQVLGVALDSNTTG